MQEEELQVLSDARYTVDLFAQSAKIYWRMWGPLGDPMVRGVDTWAELQRECLQWVSNRAAARAGGVPVPQTTPPMSVFPLHPS